MQLRRASEEGLVLPVENCSSKCCKMIPRGELDAQRERERERGEEGEGERGTE